MAAMTDSWKAGQTNCAMGMSTAKRNRVEPGERKTRGSEGGKNRRKQPDAPGVGELSVPHCCCPSTCRGRESGEARPRGRGFISPWSWRPRQEVPIGRDSWQQDKRTEQMHTGTRCQQRTLLSCPRDKLVRQESSRRRRLLLLHVQNLESRARDSGRHDANRSEKRLLVSSLKKSKTRADRGARRRDSSNDEANDSSKPLWDMPSQISSNMSSVSDEPNNRAKEAGERSAIRALS